MILNLFFVEFMKVFRIELGDKQDMHILIMKNITDLLNDVTI